MKNPSDLWLFLIPKGLTKSSNWLILELIGGKTKCVSLKVVK